MKIDSKIRNYHLQPAELRQTRCLRYTKGLGMQNHSKVSETLTGDRLKYRQMSVIYKR
jgi:hypothetical protein